MPTLPFSILPCSPVLPSTYGELCCTPGKMGCAHSPSLSEVDTEAASRRRSQPHSSYLPMVDLS